MFVGHFLTLGRGLALAACVVSAGISGRAWADPGPPPVAVGLAGVGNSAFTAASADSLGPPGLPPEPPVPADEDSLLTRSGSAMGLTRESPGALAPDRLQHASLAFAAGLALGLVTESPAAAGGGAAVIGLGKELTDDPFDRGDLIADLVGAALAAFVTAALRR